MVPTYKKGIEIYRPRSFAGAGSLLQQHTQTELITPV